MSPLFEYDPEKSKKNKERHGIDFEEAQLLWIVPHVVFPAQPFHGEERHINVGELSERVYMAVFTFRGPRIRLISCHRADERWMREYERRRYET
jgi:uncharacterized DUF497 family protein